MTDESLTSHAVGGHAAGAAEFDAAAAREESPAAGARFADLPWRVYTRCFLLAAVMLAVAVIAFRPGMLRLSILMSLVSPSRGDSLAWKPADEESPRLAPVKLLPPPGEWRLAAGHETGPSGERPAAAAGAWRGGEVADFPWKRESHNPWGWSDDAGRGSRRGGEQDPEYGPGQKPASPFRAGAEDAWGTAAASPAAAETETAPAAGANNAATPFGEAFFGAGPGRVPSVAPILPPAPLTPLAPLAPLEPLSGPAPDLPALPSAQNADDNAPIVSEAISLSDLPLLALADGRAEPAAPAQTAPTPALAPTPTPRPAETPAAPGTISPAQLFAAAPAAVNWLEQEITAPIPGAYLTIYPKLNFVGLCVPDQGYIRKYNQIAVPMDTAQPKQYAADGRTPYGRYYVAARSRDASGARLALSWPSVADAERAGVGPELLALVDRAWREQTLPPQDTLAGGGLSLDGARARTEYTTGGFSLEEPHMEEIFTALPDGAWVFIQE